MRQYLLAIALTFTACAPEGPRDAASPAGSDAPTRAASLPPMPPDASAVPSAALSPSAVGGGQSTPAAASVPNVDIPPNVSAVVKAVDRSSDDKKLDAGRHPAETLALLGIAPGMRVAELVAGGGYTTELLARGVAPGGAVYAENPRRILEFTNKAWSERLAKPVMKSVVREDRELDAPLSPEAKNLDAVVCILNYHDTVWWGVDRAKMNAAVFAALKPGGVYLIVDHSAKSGTGFADVKTLHRIDEGALRQDVERAGFRLQSEADFLRNPSDTRDWSAAPRVAGERRGTSDRFVLKYVKP